MFRASTITSKGLFNRKQGREMGLALCDKLNHNPKACWLFCAPGPDLGGLVQGIAETVGTKKIVGCTTDGEISKEGITNKSAVLAGIATDRIDFELVLSKNISKDSNKAGKDIGQQFLSPVKYIHLFSDGITGNGCAILRGVQSVLGKKVAISGGTAGDNGKFIRTWQFAGTEVLTDAVVGMGFYGDFEMGLGIRSGWSPVGLAKKITRAKGNVLYELNNEPALKVYERFLGKHANKLPSVGVEYPLGLIDKCWLMGDSEYYLLRATMSVDRRDGSITFAGDMPEGATVRLTCADSSSILDAAQKAAQTAKDQLGDHEPMMAFVYSCMARKIVLGRKISEELVRIRQSVGNDVPLAGFFTYGEFSPLRPHGTCVLHNETVTVSLIGL